MNRKRGVKYMKYGWLVVNAYLKSANDNISLSCSGSEG